VSSDTTNNADAKVTYVGTRDGMWGSGSGSGDVSGFAGQKRTLSLPTPATMPYGEWFDDCIAEIETEVDGAVAQVFVWRGELTVFTAPERLLELFRALRDKPSLRFEICSSVSGVHYPEQVGSELHVVYQLLSITHNRRIRIEIALPDARPLAPSCVAIYPMANYHERETYDMFGIMFEGHPGLTRILMPDDWEGYPLRKDYPLGGIPVQFKGASVPPVDQRRSYQQ
jgi:NADH-quinone oxidoreductase subunit C